MHRNILRAARLYIAHCDERGAKTMTGVRAYKSLQASIAGDLCTAAADVWDRFEGEAHDEETQALLDRLQTALHNLVSPSFEV
jgi:hypothetical protein